MDKDTKQIVPGNVCLSCDVCCRFPQQETVYAPYFLSCETGILKDKIAKKIEQKPFPPPCKDYYACRFFNPSDNHCSIYLKRPLDCRIYPFMVTYSKDFKSAVLTLDKKCPYTANKTQEQELKEYSSYLADILETKAMVEQINRDKNFINDFQEDSIVLKKLDNISQRLGLDQHGLKKISINDKEVFDKCFSRINSNSSCFSFVSIYIWSGSLNILWKKMDECLCVFAGNDRDYFMLIPPFGGKIDKKILSQCLDILSALNAGSRFKAKIENIPQGFEGSLSSLGLKIKMASQEYIYKQNELSQLKGDKFKEKRSSVNGFLKNYKYTLRPFVKEDAFACLELYKKWAKQRLIKIKDDYFRLSIEDSYSAQKTAMLNIESLGLKGLIVEIDGEIKGYTLGYSLNKEVFVVLFETCDLKIKGLAQFIFKEFCARLSNFKYINALGDSGLENLRKQKESYRPIQRLVVFTALPTSSQLPS